MKAFYHPAQLKHHPRTYFSRGAMREPQEVPQRLEHLVDAARALGMELVHPDDFGMQPLLAVHDQDYLEFLQNAHQAWQKMPADWGQEVISNIFVREPNPRRGILAQAAYYIADGSAPIGEHTWEAAYWSAQNAVAGAQALLQGERRAYSICRPPGHHARRSAAGGFCFLNNAAIAAQHLRQKFERVVVLDTDMHHGQGIQEIFYDRDDVFYMSVHGDPENFYPVTAGFSEEQGEGAGKGFNLNLSMPHGSEASVFFDYVEQTIQQMKDYKADALVLSLGFDIYEKDPQAQVQGITTAGFEHLGKLMASTGLPVLVVQEGGYYLEDLQVNTEAFFNGLKAGL